MKVIFWNIFNFFYIIEWFPFWLVGIITCIFVIDLIIFFYFFIFYGSDWVDPFSGWFELLTWKYKKSMRLISSLARFV